MRERETNEKKKEMNKRRWQSDRAKKPFILTYMYPSIFIQTMLMVDPLPDRCVVGFCCDPPTPSITSTPAASASATPPTRWTQPKKTPNQPKHALLGGGKKKAQLLNIPTARAVHSPAQLRRNRIGGRRPFFMVSSGPPRTTPA